MAKALSHQQILALPLHQQALAWEERRHQARLHEIKQIAATLALLQPLQAAIAAAGANIYANDITPVYGKRQTLRITTAFTSAEVFLAKALLRVGFTIVERDDHRLRTVVFKRGRLSIQMCMTEENLARAEQEFATAAAPAPARAESEVAA
ncbi:hypothetical protein [Cupriavidus sp. DL-D2]|uniref:hypothetical protein n=1 Tax=Cupriavidus sp. DL-D2 TaxID=3144974 RepID=UPI003212D336